MSITSLSFLALVAGGLVLYYLCPKGGRWVVLLALSCVFYLSGGWGAGCYLLLTALTTWAAGLALGRLNAALDALPAGEGRRAAARGPERGKRLTVLFVLLANFGLLYAVKYWDFTASLAGGLGLTLPTLDLLVPLGLSFYTFQAVGYVIDTYRGKVEPEKNPLKYLLFVSFFPQMTQGPIGRYGELAPQLLRGNGFSWENCRAGLTDILAGLLKKLVLADRAGVVVSAVIDHYTEYSGSVIAFAVLLYCLQIYCDFSGGIDLVRGVARLYGVELAENFRRPFFATSVADFWRRWHISLGTWMKDYVFYPLSLSRPFLKLGKFTRRRVGGRLGKLIPSALATFVVYLIIGFWHGAQWKYVAFGIWNGTIISLSQLLKPTFSAWRARLDRLGESGLYHAFEVLRTFLLVFIGRYLARGIGFMAAVNMLLATVFRFTPSDLWNGTLMGLGLAGIDYWVLLIGTIILFVIETIQEKQGSLAAFLDRRPAVLQWLVVMAGLLCLLYFGIFREGYIASQFIYQQY